jgi:hypothetical protein
MVVLVAVALAGVGAPTGRAPRSSRVPRAAVLPRPPACAAPGAPRGARARPRLRQRYNASTRFFPTAALAGDRLERPTRHAKDPHG